MEKYDYIIAGGGAAGLSLAYHLLHSKLREHSILIVDRDKKVKNDRTWCFWSNRPTYYDPIYYRSWQKLAVIASDTKNVFSLGSYQYCMIRGIDFYAYTRQALEARKNIRFLTASVDQIIDGPEYSIVVANHESYLADWVFDSRFSPDIIQQGPGRWHYLYQHFRGWLIRTEQDEFDPSTPYLFDFRTAQERGLCFFYVLPFSSQEALIEYTIFSDLLLPSDAYDEKLKQYIHDTLMISKYTVIEVESGVIPMTDYPFQRKLGNRILSIGTRGGLVKPSSGYAFLRIQNDSAAIVRSLEKYGHPFGIPHSPSRYRWFDSLLLEVLQRESKAACPIFLDLFTKNPIETIFRFLDETGNIAENLKILASLPALPFMRALIRLL
ncbi:lycopene cyclase protein [Anaerolinea thermolimosa]|uniref:lycopene cyclase family protein n=1 Tax=Anaerolinea thermolimosa TaxID=229919 RepID=UPI0007852896|nr:lycopene cyclase family protein [Anaerolinea thermolimosa]GAP06717.1 lycopene cyclase protein [Anaerolinea thermolimosa]